MSLVQVHGGEIKTQEETSKTREAARVKRSPFNSQGKLMNTDKNIQDAVQKASGTRRRNMSTACCNMQAGRANAVTGTMHVGNRHRGAFAQDDDDHR